MDKIDASGRSNRFTAGIYDVRIDRCEVVKGFHGPRFVMEGEILHSSGVDALPEGGTASWTASIDGKYADLGLADVKALVEAAAPKGTKVDHDYMAKVVGPDQVLKGRTVHTEAWCITTKSGNDMTKHRWDGMDAATPPPPPPVAAFPPKGWAPHPSAPGYFFKDQEVLSEGDLRELTA